MQDAIQVIRAGFAHVLLDVAFDCSAPIYWFPMTGAGRGPVLNNGTIFFVNAGAGIFAVTARHVLEGYRDAVSDDQRMLCEIGGIGYDLLDNVIAEDRTADLATLRIDEETLRRVRRTPHQNPRAWPPKSPEFGKGVFFGGYPGKYRVEDPGILHWGFAGGLDVATIVEEDHISVRFNRDD